MYDSLLFEIHTMPKNIQVYPLNTLNHVISEDTVSHITFAGLNQKQSHDH